MNHIAIVIDWFGPYRGLEEARAALKKDYEDGLYVGIGKVKHQKGRARIQYVGISKELLSRVCNAHHKLNQITRDQHIWLGEVASVGSCQERCRISKQRFL